MALDGDFSMDDAAAADDLGGRGRRGGGERPSAPVGARHPRSRVVGPSDGCDGVGSWRAALGRLPGGFPWGLPLSCPHVFLDLGAGRVANILSSLDLGLAHERQGRGHFACSLPDLQRGFMLVFCISLT